MNRCVLLFTGGRKSRLAARLLQAQRCEVMALHVRYPWCDDAEAERVAGRMELPFVSDDVYREQWKFALAPKKPEGSWGAPCGDCQALQLSRAAALMKRKKADFIATGDIFDSLPCRSPESYAAADEGAGLVGKVLRPLSALHLPESDAERDGLIDRAKLLGLSGGGKKAFLAASAKAGLHLEEVKAATCAFGERRLGERFAHYRSDVREKGDPADLELLSLGRHFLSGKCRIVVPSSHEEDERLRRLARDGDWQVQAIEVEGPAALVRGPAKEEILRQAASLLAKSAGALRASSPIEFSATRRGSSDRARISVNPRDKPDSAQLLRI